MPNRQIILYDKRREVIEKRNPVGFDIWSIDPADMNQTVHRVEIRLGQTELTKWEMRILDIIL